MNLALSILALVLLSGHSATAASSETYHDVYLTCPDWRDIDSPPLIIIEDIEYPLLVNEVHGKMTPDQERALYFLQDMTNDACDPHNLSHASQKFTATGFFQTIRWKKSFLVDRIIE